VVDAATGAVAQRMDYDSFGTVLQDTNPGFQPFGFAGGLHDRATGLVRFGARDYDPQTGRWTAKDPMLFAAGEVNLYVYASGDPVNFTDPDGREPGVLDVYIAGFGAGVGAAAIPVTVTATVGYGTVSPALGVVTADVSLVSSAGALGLQPAGAVLTGAVEGTLGVPLGVSSGSVIAGEGAAAIAGAGWLAVAGAAALGYTVGTLMDWGITAALGKTLGEAIYDRLHPEESAPAYDPTRDPAWRRRHPGRSCP
jgi:RHS repeat-associated protein